MGQDVDAPPDPPIDPRTWLRQELDGWLADRLITGSQARKLLQRYDLPDDGISREADTRHAGRLIAVLGSILVGVGVLLIVGANWEDLPRFVRLALLIGSTGVCYAVGYELAYERRSSIAGGTALLLLGSMLYGSSIFLIAQMYHLGGHGGEQRGLMYWVAGVLPLAYVLRSRLQLGLGVTLTGLWICLELGALDFTAPQAMFLAMLAIACLAYVVGLHHRAVAAYESFADVYTGLAAAIGVLALYVLSFSDVWDSGYYSHDVGAAVWLWLVPVVAVAAGGALLLLRQNATGDRLLAGETGAVLGLTVLTGALLAYVAVGGGFGDAGQFVLGVVFNALLLGAEAGLVAVGVQRGSPTLINFGLAAFALHVVTRYFDVFAELLPSGLMFVGAGALLIVGGVALDRGRRRLVAAAREATS